MLKIASLIRLKSEYEERYIILHKYPFPGVLERLRKSHLSHYSIFLRDGLLFSYQEYDGTDYERDMNKISLDPITLDWWKLTDPMQEPLSTRKSDEWWSPIEEIMSVPSERPSGRPTRRFAFTGTVESESRLRELGSTTPPETPQILSRYALAGMSCFFHPPSRIFVFGEYTQPDLNQLFIRLSKESSLRPWIQSFQRNLCVCETFPSESLLPMTEVFHMD